MKNEKYQTNLARRAVLDLSGTSHLYSVLIAPVVAATASIGRIGNHVPEGDKDGRADKSAHQGNGRSCWNVDVANACDMDEICHQPDADERGNDCADESEGETPAYNCFRDKTNNGCYDQVDDNVCAEREAAAADGDGDGMGEQGRQNVHSITPLYFEMETT